MRSVQPYVEREAARMLEILDSAGRARN